MANKVLKTAVIDDSDLQLKVIAKLVSKHPNLALEATYESGTTAKKDLTNHQIDLIFLDIEMPVISGFDFLDTLENRPQVIVVSGKPDYALKAFDYDVTDYLQKPIRQERFNSAVQRALTNHLQLTSNEEEQDFIFVNSNLQKKKVIVNQIKWIEALGDYIKLVTEDDNTILVLSTMKSFLKRLPADKFVRIHKSYSVNVERVEKFCSTNVEIAGKLIPMSRQKKGNLEKALMET